MEALDLVRGRRVYLHRGFAYVPQDDLVSILLTVYRIQLSHSLAVGAFFTLVWKFVIPLLVIA